MRIVEFIRTHPNEIEAEWGIFAKSMSSLEREVVSVNWWKSSWHQLSASEQLTILLPTLPPFAD